MVYRIIQKACDEMNHSSHDFERVSKHAQTQKNFEHE